MFSGAFQPTHLILILVIALIVFGPGKLPEVGKSLGKTVRDFKQAMNSSYENLQEEAKQGQITQTDSQEQQPMQIVQASQKPSN